MSNRARAKRIQAGSGDKEWSYSRSLQELRNASPQLNEFRRQFSQKYRFKSSAVDAWVVNGDASGLPRGLQMELLGTVVEKGDTG